MRINLKHFLDYASHKNPQAVAQAVIATAKKHVGMMRRGGGGYVARGMGDASSDTAAVNAVQAYLTDPNLYSLDVAGSGAGFLANGAASPLANPTVVNAATGQPAANAPWWQSLFTSLTTAAPNLLTAYTANQQLSACSQTNQSRLSAGLPPVDCSSFAPTANVGLSPATSSLFLLLGGGALLLMFMGRKSA
jgi:hypothetical protein